MLIQFTEFVKASDTLELGNSVEHINTLNSLRLHRNCAAVQFVTNSGSTYAVYCEDVKDAQRVFESLRNSLLSGREKFALLRRACCHVTLSECEDSALAAATRRLNTNQIDKNITPVVTNNGMNIMSSCAMLDESSGF